MNKAASRAMFLGDLVVISVSALFLIFRSSYEPKLLFDLSVAIFPFAAIWSILAWMGEAYDLRLPLREFIRRNLLLWLAAVALAQASRFVLMYLFSSAILTPTGIAIEAVAMTFIFVLWKSGSYLMYKISTHPEKKIAKRVVGSLVLAMFFLGFASVLPFTYSAFKYSGQIYSLEDAPAAEAALVLGAGVWPDGTPSTVMVARVRAARDLYQSGKVSTIVLSGSSDEVEAMLRLAESFGLDGDALALDISGVTTLDSCLNLVQDHDFSQVAVISQKFHLYRALYLCDSVGLQSMGIVADSEPDLPEIAMRRYFREVLGTAAGFVQVQAIRLRQ